MTHQEQPSQPPRCTWLARNIRSVSFFGTAQVTDAQARAQSRTSLRRRTQHMIWYYCDMKLSTRSCLPVDPRHLGRGRLGTRPSLAYVVDALLGLARSSGSQARDLVALASSHPDRP